MKVKLKKIILVCDEEVRCNALTSLFKKVKKNTKLNFAGSFHKLSLLLKEKIPDLILIHTIKPRNNHSSMVSKLRANRKIDHVPVLVYFSSNVENNFPNLLIQLRSINSV